MYESYAGYPPLIARHFRTATADGRPQCGPHQHVVCTTDGCEPAHWDHWNPDCPGELGPHMRDDFWPTRTPGQKAAIVIGGVLLGGFLLSKILK